MRNAIREFVELSTKEKQDLWDNATFVFDTNVFLNLYRYSKKTRDALLSAMKKFEDRIWMPYQVALEFMRRRPEVINESVRRYDTFEQTVTDFCVNHFRMSAEDQEYKKLQKCIKDWTAGAKSQNLTVESVHEDSTLDELLNLFDGKTGKAYPEEDLKKIKAEGESRYKAQIPPGYKDANKAKGSDDKNAYGDFIIWKEILDFSKNSGKSIIFVTHDQKEDWWQKVSGKTIGPRTELRKEFYDNSNAQFHMYTMDRFISMFQESNNTKLDNSIVEEVKSYGESQVMMTPTDALYKATALHIALGSIHNEIKALRSKNERRQADLLGIHENYTEKRRSQKIREMESNLVQNISRDESRILELQEREMLMLQELHRTEDLRK